MKQFFTLALIFISTAVFSTEKSLYICAIFNNESRFLDEWIQFHLNQGVDRIYLYNNKSEDDYLKVISKYIKQGTVALRQWPYDNINLDIWNETQCKAYMDCIKRLRGKVSWIAFIDTDEFLFSPTGKSLKDVLLEYEECDSIGVNWVLYGTSNVQKLSKDEHLTDHMLYRSELNTFINTHVKSIVRPEKVVGCTNPHYFHMEKDSVVVDENKVVFSGYSHENTVNKLRINHYWVRDIAFMLDVKAKRCERWGLNPDDLWERDSRCNLIYDPILAEIRD